MQIIDFCFHRLLHAGGKPLSEPAAVIFHVDRLCAVCQAQRIAAGKLIMPVLTLGGGTVSRARHNADRLIPIRKLCGKAVLAGFPVLFRRRGKGLFLRYPVGQRERFSPLVHAAWAVVFIHAPAVSLIRHADVIGACFLRAAEDRLAALQDRLPCLRVALLGILLFFLRAAAKREQRQHRQRGEQNTARCLFHCTFLQNQCGSEGSLYLLRRSSRRFCSRFLYFILYSIQPAKKRTT